ncbi:MAG TPA: hypothetical protein VED41_04345 [Solirubrobacteraceae bacterium]|nr:hypothetical protein [Solirubrobacteraceae bacterium]
MQYVSLRRLPGGYWVLAALLAIALMLLVWAGSARADGLGYMSCNGTVCNLVPFETPNTTSVDPGTTGGVVSVQSNVCATVTATLLLDGTPVGSTQMSGGPEVNGEYTTGKYVNIAFTLPQPPPSQIQLDIQTNDPHCPPDAMGDSWMAGWYWTPTEQPYNFSASASDPLDALSVGELVNYKALTGMRAAVRSRSASAQSGCVRLAAASRPASPAPSS